MTVGGVVEYDSDEGRYFLPAEHAALLTRAAGGDNMASLMQYFAVLGTVEDQLVDCFRKGGGVPYTEYKRFHAVMAEESGQSTVGSLIDHILPLAPGMVEALQAGADVLDIGCGSGRALNLMARTFPNSRFVGYDLSKEALRVAKSEANGNGNIRFEARDLSSFDDDGPTARFDFVTSFDAIHDQARPDRVLKGIHRALRPDGVYLMQDIAGSNRVENNMDHSLGAFVYTISCMHCMTVSLAQGGMGLGAMWGEETAVEMLHAAGFRTIEVRRLEQDILNNYYVAGKS
jgi:2-polyprenyl-3-methyl-5-hydroxy-6-metoxy-1,4-benzoquinol methylase